MASTPKCVPCKHMVFMQVYFLVAQAEARYRLVLERYPQASKMVENAWSVMHAVACFCAVPSC